MKPFKDFYFTLGLTRTASQIDIDRAYEYSANVVRTSALGDASAMTEAQRRILADIEEAYACLSNPMTRSAYDMTFDEFIPKTIRIGPDGGYKPRNNTKEAMAHAFIAMNKKKSRSISLSGLFSTAMFLLCIGFVSAIGYYYLRTGRIGFFGSPGAASSVQLEKTGPLPAPIQAGIPPRPAVERQRQTFVRAFEIRYGGVITAGRTTCRKEPSESAPATNTMGKNAVVFVTKEARARDGSVWYYAENGNGTGWGWINGEDIKVYK
ncbi:MAG: hypothetical protein LBS93_05650 [Synergistaceae bacterium]|jgi:hypothetical protein|nr:hypothetical protein [Synergistaceae bacterium]